MSNLERGNKKLLNAWAFYDWANSVYPLVISSSIFPLYYGALFRIKGIEEIEVFGHSTGSQSLISYVTAIGFMIVAFISPLLSGVADYLGNKKSFLKFFCYMGSLSCMALYFFSLDNILISLFTYMLALVGFWGSLVFYNSYLPDIAFPEQQDKVSAKGYQMGYIGSVILLLLNLVMVLKFKWFGFESELPAMQFCFLMVGLWWMGFSQYTYLYLPSVGNGNKLHRHIFLNGFKELKKVSEKLVHHIPLKRYLTAFFVYSMAVQTVMIAAAYFGEKEVKWGSDSERVSGLIISILLIQLIAVLGAYLTSKASGKFGNIRVLVAINSMWILICIYAYFVVTPQEFYIAAACVGLVMGGIQSLSRSTYSKLLPSTQDTTSFFSFYDVSEKIGIVIGMFLYGFIADVTGKVQNAILFLVVFFIAGLLLLLRVPASKDLEIIVLEKEEEISKEALS